MERRRKIMLATVGLMALAGLFPPGIRYDDYATRAFLLFPVYGFEVEFKRLVIEWAVIAGVGWACLMAFGSEPKK